MKKLFTLAIVALCTMSMSAQTTITWPTVEEAEAAGYEALWGDYAYGYNLPDNYTFVDNDEITVTLPVTSIVASNFTTGEGETPIASYMGSSIGDNTNDAPFSFDGLFEGMKQNYAVFKVTPKVSGRLTLQYDRGGSNFTMYVFDATANDEDGQYILANTVTSNDGETKIKKTHTSVVDLTADHEYWVFGSGTGNNIYLYGMSFCPMTSDDYYQAYGTFDTEVAWPTIDDAEAAGYEALWGDYAYGYNLPDNYTFVDNDDITVTLPVTSIVASNFTTGEGATPIASYMGSSIGDNTNDAPFSFDGLFEGMKQNYAVFKVTPKTSGVFAITYDRGGSNFTMYVFDSTANDEDGQYILANTVTSNDGETKIKKSHTSIIDLTADHEYWVFGSGTGNNIYLWEMKYTAMSSDNYYSCVNGVSNGIKGIVSGAALTTTDNRIYSIDGRYLGTNKANLGKGLYIMNGQKVVIK